MGDFLLAMLGVCVALWIFGREETKRRRKAEPWHIRQARAEMTAFRRQGAARSPKRTKRGSPPLARDHFRSNPPKADATHFAPPSPPLSPPVRPPAPPAPIRPPAPPSVPAALNLKLDALTKDRGASERLVNGVQARYPGSTRRWATEKAIADLERDRQRG